MSKPVLAVFFLLLCNVAFQANAEVINFPFETELEETRFQSLLMELRCPKCQNQSLAESDAPIAMDLRQKIYELIKEGKSDQEIREYLVARYGDFINYRPPLRANTIILWAGPVVLLLFSLILAFFLVSRNQRELLKGKIDQND